MSNDKNENHMNYPKRGCMSEDRKFYTHTDGSVHHRAEPNPSEDSCSFCSLEWLEHDGRPCENCEHVMWIIPGEYVPSDEEREACDMAREAIKKCVAHYAWLSGCKSCTWFIGKTCDTRKYLSAHHQPDAWDVKP